MSLRVFTRTLSLLLTLAALGAAGMDAPEYSTLLLLLAIWVVVFGSEI